VASAQDGIDEARVTPWLEEHVEGVRPPLSYSLIAGGHSNLTYRVDDAGGGAYVLRRPPLGHVLATAHDMGREHRIISALGPTPVPVAPALAYCDDTEVNGAPFYVMGFVEGHVLHDTADVVAHLPQSRRRRAGESLVEVAAALHRLDVDAIGVGDLGRREDYVARQMARWYRQYQASGGATPLMDRLHDALGRRLPTQQRASLVHGDYRLGNCITAGDGSVAAVLDWEICTLGDPLADLGYLLAMWLEPGDDFETTATSPSNLPGFPTRAEMLEHYRAHSELDLSDIGVYVAFSYWKVACINQGVWARYDAGQKAADGVDVAAIRASVDRLAVLAERALTAA
jgi:aminoglycoside phosphotransferase (APT) family kinase protein